MGFPASGHSVRNGTHLSNCKSYSNGRHKTAQLPSTHAEFSLLYDYYMVMYALLIELAMRTGIPVHRSLKTKLPNHM